MITQSQELLDLMSAPLEFTVPPGWTVTTDRLTGAPLVALVTFPVPVRGTGTKRWVPDEDDEEPEAEEPK